jgi:hypothetical protein
MLNPAAAGLSIQQQIFDLLRRSAVVFPPRDINPFGDSHMTPTTELFIRCAVGFVVGFTLAYCTCWLLSIFLWGWLAVILSILLSWMATDTEPVQHATRKAGDLAVSGAAHAMNAFAGLRARFTK